MKNTAVIPEWKLERFVLGELPPPEMERIRKAAESDPAVHRRLQQLQDSNQDILEQYPPESMAAGIRERAAAKSARVPAEGRFRPFASLPRLAAVAVAVTVLFLIFLPKQMDRNSKNSAEKEITFKGSAPALVLYRKIPSGAEILSDGDVARPGDTVQIAYRGISGHYGVIVSLDGKGEVTLHFPEQGSDAAPLESGNLTRLGSAYELDDTPGWECFYFVTADRPFEIDAVMQAARGIGRVTDAPHRLPLSNSFSQFSVRLRKTNTK